jgi:hypothetical protein
MDRGAQFSYEGLETLFDFLTESEYDNYQLELDVIAFCCEYVEMTMYEAIDAYNIDVNFDRPLDIQVHEYLEAKTTVCGITSVDTIVFQQF